MQSFLHKYVQAEAPFLLNLKESYSDSTLKLQSNKSAPNTFDSIGSLIDLERDFLARKKAKKDQDFSSVQSTEFSSLVQAAYRKKVSLLEFNAKKNFNQLTEKYFPSPLFQKEFSTPPLQRVLENTGMNYSNIVFIDGKIYSSPSIDSLEHSLLELPISIADFLSFHEQELSPTFAQTKVREITDCSPVHVQSSCTVSSVRTNLYDVKITSPDYVIQKENTGYLFSGFVSQFRVYYSGSEGSILGKPSISFPKKYAHPFVFDDAKICFNSDFRWKRKNIPFQKIPLTTTKEYLNFVNAIAYVAFETTRTLKEGYRKNVHPVKLLSDFSNKKISLSQAVNKGVFVYDNT